MKQIPMKYLLITALLTLILSCANKKATKEKSDAEKMNLKGKIKSIKENSFILYGGKIVMASPGENAENTNDVHIIFNENGNMLVHYKYSGNKLFDSTHYTYDAAGRQSSQELFTTDGKMHFLTKITYDQAGRKAEENQVFEDHTEGDKKTVSKTITSYDDESRPTLVKTYVSDTLVKISCRDFDNRGNLLKDSTEMPKTKKAGISNYTYDENDNCTSIKLRYDKFEQAYEYGFDEKGNKTSSKTPFSKTKWKYTYTFDSLGNWVTQTQIGEFGPVYLVKRQIEYRK